MNIQLMRIVVDTTVDGPGWRTSVYCAGCRHACPGCHNPETWSFQAGESVSVDEIFERLAATEGNITFSGGDPMYQAEAFTALSKRIVNELHRTIWCYTGFTFEEVQADPVMRQMLPYLEVLVDGPFLQEQRNLDLMFRGSKNQRLVDVPASLRAGHVVEYEWDPYPKF
ncbi:MAG: anaerobic ribonucleoside-triphosphate reductase activating protein [Bacteroidales bacterium]|nr:anaerobic ribonucleoside-triphosphate reductase activating protein [Bacteroidales bacterium]